MHISKSFEAYESHLAKLWRSVQAIEPDRAQEAEEHLINLLCDLSLEESWDFAKEWHHDNNCVVIVIKNIEAFTLNFLQAVSDASQRYNEVLFHIIVTDSIENDILGAPEQVSQFIYYSGLLAHGYHHPEQNSKYNTARSLINQLG